MKFQIFRYYLTPTSQKSLFDSGKDFEIKHEVMQEIFSRKLDFSSIRSKSVFAYRLGDKIEDRYFFAKLGKQALKTHSLKVDDNFLDKKEEEWPNRQLIIDTDPKVQLIAFELRNPAEFNKPVFVLQRFAEHLNTVLPESGWHIAIEPIIDKNVFWEIIRKHSGEIKRLKFTYHVPNLFGVENTVEQELDIAKREFLAQKVEAVLTNEQSNLQVPENSAFVQQSVEHISKGGGSYEIKLSNTTVITNKTEVKTVNIRQAEISTSNFVDLQEIIDQLFK